MQYLHKSSLSSGSMHSPILANVTRASHFRRRSDCMRFVSPSPFQLSTITTHRCTYGVPWIHIITTSTHMQAGARAPFDWDRSKGAPKGKWTKPPTSSHSPTHLEISLCHEDVSFLSFLNFDQLCRAHIYTFVIFLLHASLSCRARRDAFSLLRHGWNLLFSQLNLFSAGYFTL